MDAYWIRLNKWVNDYGKTAITPNNQPLYTFDEFVQLRQLKSKFHDPSTYNFRRASSAITNDLRLRPVTIWTLANVDSNSTVGSARSILRLFQALAMCVWEGKLLKSGFI